MMRSLWGQKVFLTGLWIAGCLSFQTPTEARAWKKSLFSRYPSCNTSLAVTTLRQSLRSLPESTSDGHVPWPDLSGFWVSPKRDLLINVSFADSSHFRVSFYSLCDRVLWAAGYGQLLESNKPQSSLHVEMQSLSRETESFSLEVLPDRNRRTTEIRVWDLNETGVAIPQEDFKAQRLTF